MGLLRKQTEEVVPNRGKSGVLGLIPAVGCELVENTLSRAFNSLILFNEQSLVKAKILLLDLFHVFFS